MYSLPPLSDDDTSDDVREMLDAMRQLTDVLLDLSDHLASLSTAVLDDPEVVATRMQPRSTHAGSDCKAVGSPLGPDLVARGMGDLFRQYPRLN